MNAMLTPAAAPAMTDHENELHILACGAHMEAAYRRFQDHGNPQDRDEAVLWQDLQRQAIEARSPAQRARMEKAIDDGLDFFQTQGQLAHRMAQARGISHA